MPKIPYVEDDLSLIDGLKYTLESSGYDIDNARTVKEALSLFRINHYNLLLLDVTLPDGTGFDVCKRDTEQFNDPDYIFNCVRSGDQYCERPQHGRRRLYHKAL